jgi:hypothetical protein
VLVVVAFVICVPVAVVEVVHMVPVLDRFVCAVRAAMPVLVRGVFRRVIVLVVVALVFCMPVAVMDVVHVVPMLHGDVIAVRSPVLMLGKGVLGLDFLGHDVSFADAGRLLLAFLAMFDAATVIIQLIKASPSDHVL